MEGPWLHFLLPLVTQCLTLHPAIAIDLPSIHTTPKSPDGGQLEHFVINEDQGYIFIGGWDVIHVLSLQDLALVKQISTGPSADGLYCPPNSTDECPECPLENPSDPACEIYRGTDQRNVNKALVLDKDHQTLLACSNLYYGFCQKVSLETLEVSEPIYKPVAGASADHRVVMFLANGSVPHLTLYVAVSSIQQVESAYTQRIPILSSRDPGSLEYIKTNSFVDMSPSSQFRFVSGFGYNGYNYFFIVSETGGQAVAKIIRVCQKDATYKSYVEMRMLCNPRQQSYTSISSVSLGKLGKKLATSVGRATGEPAVFVTFQNAGDSALCVYSMVDVEETFYKTIKECFAGDGNLGPDHLLPAPERCIATDHNITKDYCHGYDENAFIVSPMAATPVAEVGPLAGDSVSAVVVKTYGKQTIIYQGTESGEILELVVQNYKKWNVVRRVTLDMEAQVPKIKEMKLTPDGTEIVALSDTMVHKIDAAVDCSQYRSCATCSNADPHCGWCLASKRCVTYGDCVTTIVGYLDECPMVKSITPQAISVSRLSQGDSFMLELNIPVSGTVSCVFLAGKTQWNINATANGTQVFCGTLAGFPTLLPPDRNHLVTNLTVSANIHYQPLEITIYDCSGFDSCTACAGASYPCQDCTETGPYQPCGWCPSSHQCLSKTSAAVCAAPPAAGMEESGDGDKLADLNLIPVNTNANGSNTAIHLRQAVENAIEDIAKCPRVVLEDGAQQPKSHAGKLIQVQLRAVNLMAYQRPLKCRFDLPDGTTNIQDGEIITDSATQAASVRCDQTVLNYASDEPSIQIPVSVVWDDNKELDSPQPVAVEVYKCGRLAQTCGFCGTMDVAYMCTWCDAKCTLEDQCTAEKVERDEACPDPKITKISPSSGPVWGGTTITVEGINLGKKASDIAASLGGERCVVEEREYVPARSFACITGAVEKGQHVSIEVSVIGIHNTTFSQPFAYLQPSVSRIDPAKGPVSGGTIAVLRGRNLDIGTDIQILVESQESEIKQFNSTQVLFLTPRQISSKMHATVTVFVDAHSATSQPLTFQYLNDPVVKDVKPLDVFVNGGTFMEFTGSNLDCVSQPEMIIYTDTGSVKTDCVNITVQSLKCPVPDLSGKDLGMEQSGPLPLDYGLIMDGVAEVQRLTDQPKFSPLHVYLAPVVFPFDGVIKYTPKMVLNIRGERLDVIPGLVVTVGGSECAIVTLNLTYVACAPPMEPDLLDKNNRAAVVVRLDRYQSMPGHMGYEAESNDHISMGIMMGIAVGAGLLVLSCILISCICWCKYRRGKKNQRDSVFIADTNHHAVGHHRNAVEIEMEPIHPKQTVRPQISPPILIKAPDAAANYKDAVATRAEMEPLNDFSGSWEAVDVVPGAATDDELTDAGDESDEWDDEPEEDIHFELKALLDKLTDEKLKNDVREVYIPRDKLELGDVLGKGHFGCVYSATLRNNGGTEPTQVAVKTVQGSNLDQAAIEAFLTEGVIMKNFNHPHILNLLGVCIDNKNPMMVLPYMAQGDLRTYVKDKKKNFTARQLLQLAQQVAEGMAYLSALNYVHRDLAARNCMIDDQNVVKVADFGLSRDTYERDYFHSKDKKGKLPIKWMALESLQNLIFTFKSDVWSFGVLLWELMTRGVSPYPDVDAFDVRDYLATGRRLYQPKYCPDNVYKIMLACWQENPKKRPTFTDLVNTMELMLNPPQKKNYADSEEDEPTYQNVEDVQSQDHQSTEGPSRPRRPAPIPT